MIIGFTGTRQGMTPYQKETVTHILREWGTELHHGDCIGADQEAGRIAFLLGKPIIVHPPIETRYRSLITVGTVLPAKPYMERNHDIVDACEVLIACPKETYEIRRSGTWATVRYARRHEGEKVILIIWPNPQ